MKIVVIGLVLLGLGHGQVQADSFWDFEEGTEGWQIADMPVYGPFHVPLNHYPAYQISSGGSPGAYLAGDDPSSYTFTFQMPVTALEGIETLEGGHLSYEIKSSHCNWFGEASVILDCGEVCLLAYLPDPTVDWTSQSLDFLRDNMLLESGQVPEAGQFSLLMTQVEQIYIVAEYGAQVYETTSLDSVQLIEGYGPCLAPGLSASFVLIEDAPGVRLDWPEVEGASVYHVYESLLPYGEFAHLQSTSEHFLQFGIMNGTGCYQVRTECGQAQD